MVKLANQPTKNGGQGLPKEMNLQAQPAQLNNRLQREDCWTLQMSCALGSVRPRTRRRPFWAEAKRWKSRGKSGGNLEQTWEHLSSFYSCGGHIYICIFMYISICSKTSQEKVAVFSKTHTFWPTLSEME